MLNFKNEAGGNFLIYIGFGTLLPYTYSNDMVFRLLYIYVDIYNSQIEFT